ncbi:hypothetical protein ACFO4U_05185 [Exiguobacterium profundum]|uniref:hypothetical protein n=1 Tax=Exiguobacterium TaxID=33986 RepID=UPI0018DA6F09|nr:MULTISPECIES: hypothetical protein [Exiguobacterium]MCT4797144.1 hypothetical protein [Exiguobacterium profundum]MDT0191817.1 hypothetical protein [Exiguobacterium sp. BG5(2022)]QPI68857.1 hypothetical protein IR194_06105 [Exiguobacterium sp. PBE]
MHLLQLLQDRAIPLTLFATLGLFSLVFAFSLYKSKQRLSKGLVTIGMSLSFLLLLISAASFVFTVFLGYNS